MLNYSTVFYPPDASSTLPPVMTIKMSLDIATCPLGATPAHTRKLDTNLRPVVARRLVGGRVTHTLLLLLEGLGRILAFPPRKWLQGEAAESTQALLIQSL